MATDPANNFHLIDLFDQAKAVQAVLRGQTEKQKVTWLAERGTLTLIPTRDERASQGYWFRSTLGLECAFYFSNGDIVFVVPGRSVAAAL